jgi:hypothetical protein
MSPQKSQSKKKEKRLPEVGDYVRGSFLKLKEKIPPSKVCLDPFHREYETVEYTFEGVVSSILFDFSFEVGTVSSDGTPISTWYDINDSNLLSVEII